MIAMLLAGGQGSRLGVLTEKVAKPAVAFGGKYRIIDFPLSNCINSGVDTVGVLTQYQPLRLNTHIGIGIPWDLDRNIGGVTVLPPYEKSECSEWYTGTANAIYQNIEYMENYNPDYVLILSGDHIYKMDYELMLDFHKENNADITIAAMTVPIEEAKRFGILIADEEKRIFDFEEKPENPRSNLASMGIYIFRWDILKNALIEMSEQKNCDFGKHIIPFCHEQGCRMFAYEYNGYWKDVGTLNSYWEANMELIDLIPEFNLYEEFWKIYTKSDIIPPQYISTDSIIERSIIGEGSGIYGEVYNSVIGAGVIIGKGTIVRDSIVMKNTQIDSNCFISKAIIAESVQIGDNVQLGIGEELSNQLNSDIYNHGIVTIGENSVIPPNVIVGKNTAISGETFWEDYPNGVLESGEFIIKAGDSI
ncbi:glucose-1-phosphate adenylyltransferase [Anaerosacchariphilus polymeriproducens]|uniref:Glucose-1-phosphate adenylyltransferase n=2 Tax=Anaerosacchariphilus polymeriproducens TaxID=1812858 RepID=A0A371B025_9FIRM|nr:glucose-1-phosphate adenylyltransferase [Anaerosacchariphilus polymeriproducens]